MTGWARRAAALLILAAVGLAIAATRQGDELRLVASSPAEAQTLAAGPGEARLTLSADVDPALSHITVTAQDGRQIRTGPVTAGPSHVLSVPVTLETGAAYTVGYHVAGLDGGVVAGVIRFAVGVPFGAGDTGAGSGHDHGHGVDPLSAVLLLINLGVVVTVVALLISRPPPVRRS